MTKNEFIGHLSQRCNLSKRKTGKFLDFLLEELETDISAGKTVRFNGFGKFYPSEYPERMTHSFRTGEDRQLIEGRTILRFQASKKLQRRLRKAEETNE